MSTPEQTHGVVRGSEVRRRSRTFEGRFGRLFRSLPLAEFRRDYLMALGAKMISEEKTVSRGSPNPESDIPAGYTYLGQFIDHDLTFDPVSSLQRANDVESMVNYRTPRFDLDCVYGRGPHDQPYLYEDGVRLLLGDRLDNKICDVPRNIKGRAVIGDPRNDETVIIAQLHAVFMRFHNHLAQHLAENNEDFDFATVQQLVRWHYQWVVLYDFLPRIIEEGTYNEVLPHVNGKEDKQEFAPPLNPKSNVVQDAPKLLFYKPRDEAFIPVEFSGAAYRFGHSMVRPSYTLNREPDFDPGLLPILGQKGESLVGGDRFQGNWFIDWSFFFDGISEEAKPRAQRASQIDTTLVNPLGNLQFRRPAPHMSSLAQRNLIRGWNLGLPSGQTIAEALAVPPLDNAKLKVGPGREPLTGILGFEKESAPLPLWFYILAEAQELHEGNKLGPVGSRIVMETFVGLLWEDGYSFLRQSPGWKPQIVKDGGKFGMAEFIKMAPERPLDSPLAERKGKVAPRGIGATSPKKL
jgi:hypothetical protein